MATLTDLLHDEIDEQENLRESVRNRIEKLKQQLPAIVSNMDNLGDIFEVTAGLLGDDLAEETSKAVRAGYEYARRRSNV